MHVYIYIYIHTHNYVKLSINYDNVLGAILKIDINQLILTFLIFLYYILNGIDINNVPIEFLLKLLFIT